MDISVIAQLVTAAVVSILGTVKAIVAVYAYFNHKEEVMMTGWTQFIHMTDTKKLKALCIWVD